MADEARDEPSPNRLAGQRLLILSDHAATGWVTETYLEASGAYCRRIEQEEEVLPILTEAAAKGTPFQAVVVDLRVPVTEINALGQRIKTDPTTGGVLLAALCPACRPAESSPSFRWLSRPVKKAPLLACVGEMPGGKSADPNGPAPPAGMITVREAPPPRAALNVLLVEDNVMNRKVAMRMLEKLGHRVVVAENGYEAVATFKADHTAGAMDIDVILMDGQMPGMDGIQATQAIRSLETQSGAGHRIPIIAITANAMKGDKERFLAAGMDGYITKPMKRIDIAMHLDELTPARRLHGQRTDSPVASQAAPPVDIEELLDIVDNDHQLLKECFNDFLLSRQGHLDGIKTAIDSGDAAMLERRAHRFKGNLKYIAAHQAAQTASALERAGRENRLAGVESLLPQLGKDCDDVRAFIEGFANREDSDVAA